MESVAVIEPKENTQSGAKLIIGDCRAVLRGMEDKSIHPVASSAIP